MNSFGRSKGGGRRRASRESLPLVAVFATRTRSYRAELVDISSTGLRLRADNLPAKDEDLMITVESASLYGVVAWSRMGYCGVAFDSPLPRETLDLFEARVKRGRGLPPEIVAAMDDWQLGAGR
jgi:hypothetical protein